MEFITHFLFFHTWFVYPPTRPEWYETLYHSFNLFEGAAWIVLSILVLVRYFHHRRTRLELLYAAAFFTFGLTDFQEAYRLQSWLILVKLINLIALFWLRSWIIRHHYPGSKLY